MLKKASNNGATATAEAPAPTAEAPVTTTNAQGGAPSVTIPAAPIAAPKAAPKQTAPKEAASDKESYWANKEARDIETGKRIRRSGVWQAAVQAMASLQFNQGGTIESYLELVDRIADRGLQYVNKD